ncbi:MAG TPA: hypothetical protein VGO52_22095 [Hyphomonadaceae bacterium]|jgi:hypothetical protein|nr:hypothetical protein [Hyphomonadaceae bacterium]
MALDAVVLKSLIAADLSKMPDERVLAHVRKHLVEPRPVLRDWDYGAPGEQFVCWSVFEHPPSNTGIAYCEQGFGPKMPWGLVFLDGPHMSIGMDSGWFRTFLQAYFDSMAVSDLAIWRVYRTAGVGAPMPITAQGGWDETWSEVMRRRASDPSARYDCDTDIPYERD